MSARRATRISFRFARSPAARPSHRAVRTAVLGKKALTGSRPQLLCQSKKFQPAKLLPQVIGHGLPVTRGADQQIPGGVGRAVHGLLRKGNIDLRGFPGLRPVLNDADDRHPGPAIRSNTHSPSDRGVVCPNPADETLVDDHHRYIGSAVSLDEEPPLEQLQLPRLEVPGADDLEEASWPQGGKMTFLRQRSGFDASRRWAKRPLSRP